MSFDKEQFLLDRILQLTQRGTELTAQRDAALAELAALKKRLADAERVDYYFPSRFPGPSHMTCAVVPLMEGEA